MSNWPQGPNSLHFSITTTTKRPSAASGKGQELQRRSWGWKNLWAVAKGWRRRSHVHRTAMEQEGLAKGWCGTVVLFVLIRFLLLWLNTMTPNNLGYNYQLTVNSVNSSPGKEAETRGEEDTERHCLPCSACLCLPPQDHPPRGGTAYRRMDCFTSITSQENAWIELPIWWMQSLSWGSLFPRWFKLTNLTAHWCFFLGRAAIPTDFITASSFVAWYILPGPIGHVFKHFSTWCCPPWSVYSTHHAHTYHKNAHIHIDL